MDIGTLLKLYSAKDTFIANHPKFFSFLKLWAKRPICEGTIIEVTVTRPGEEPLSGNLKVQQSDLEAIQGLLNLLHSDKQG